LLLGGRLALRNRQSALATSQHFARGSVFQVAALRKSSFGKSPIEAGSTKAITCAEHDELNRPIAEVREINEEGIDVQARGNALVR
jgi:hypothetical protein